MGVFLLIRRAGVPDEWELRRDMRWRGVLGDSGVARLVSSVFLVDGRVSARETKSTMPSDVKSQSWSVW